MRPNPLHNVDFIIGVLQATGHYPGDRRTGRSTVLALRYIAAAIEKPYQPVKLADHPATVQADRHLLHMAQVMVNKLGLEHFVFNHNTNTIQFGE